MLRATHLVIWVIPGRSPRSPRSHPIAALLAPAPRYFKEQVNDVMGDASGLRI
jgi:hypothetical protein